MSREEIIQALRANVDRAVRVTFVDGTTELVTVVNLDDEGFVNQVGDEFLGDIRGCFGSTAWK